MAANLLSSSVSVTESPIKTPTLVGGNTSTLATVGVTERGPFEATKIVSFEDYRKIFGGDTANGNLTHALRGWFANGGGEVYIKRIAHYADIDLLSSRTSAAGTLAVNTASGGSTAAFSAGTVASAYILVPGDTLSIDIDVTPTAVATFDAVAAAITAANAETYALTNGNTLLVSIDLGAPQTVTFETASFADIANATALEVAAVVNAALVGASADVDTGALRITSDKFGTASSVDVTGGTDSAVFAFPVAVAGTGDVADIAAVTFAEAKALIEADVAGCTVTDAGSGKILITSNTTGVASKVQVNAVSTADTKFGLDNAAHVGTTGAAALTFTVNAKTEGAYSSVVRVLISDATNGVADDFNLDVEYNGNIEEVFENLSMVATAENYALTAINDVNIGSNYITLVDSLSGVRPSNVTSTFLAGGDDGLVGLSDTDWIGSSVSKAGLHGYDATTDIRIMIAPGAATPAVAQALTTYCEVTKNKSVLPINDLPEGLNTASAIEYMVNTAGLKNLSEFGVTYWPSVKVLNPNKAVFGNDATIVVPNSGHMAGVWARTDSARIGGVYDAPAGTERGQIKGIVGYENDDTLEVGNRNLLYPARINPLSVVNGQRVVDGVRTYKGNGNFPSVSERRGVIFIEQTIKEGLEFARYRNNDERLRSTVYRTIRLFLIQQMNQGAFRSRVADEAFYINVGTDINTPAVICAGRLLVQIGLATQKPAEFIILDFAQDTRAKDAEAAQ